MADDGALLEPAPVLAIERMMRRVLALTAHLDPPYTARDAPAPACFVDRAHHRPASAPAVPCDWLGYATAQWAEPATACMRGDAPPLPACAPDEPASCRPVVRLVSAAVHAVMAAGAMQPRPAPAPDYAWATLGAKWWWRDGVPPRPAPAPDECRSRQRVECWRNGARARPAPAPDEPGTLFAAPWSDGARVRAGPAADAGS